MTGWDRAESGVDYISLRGFSPGDSSSSAVGAGSECGFVKAAVFSRASARGGRRELRNIMAADIPFTPSLVHTQPWHALNQCDSTPL